MSLAAIRRNVLQQKARQMTLPRVYYKCENLDKPKPKVAHAGGYNEHEYEEDVPEEEANLVSSKLAYPQGNLHAPALDVDLPVECYESSTPGHYHIYIDVPIPWRKYKKMLRAMAKAGVIEWGYYKASVKRKASYLRKKGVLKPGAQNNNAGAVQAQPAQNLIVGGGGGAGGNVYGNWANWQ